MSFQVEISLTDENGPTPKHSFIKFLNIGLKRRLYKLPEIKTGHI